jgi:polysaccharide pyruvyl transferase WcaK-like protein
LVRIGIAGWFGSDNLGDELLLHSLMMNVRAADPAASFVILCPVPERVSELHGVDAIHMPTLRAAGSAGRNVAVQRALRECDLLLLGPGTVFQERSPNLPWPGTLPMFARIVAMARTAGTPVAITGAGVREGATPAGRVMLRGIGAACLAVGVRDRRSADHFGRSAQAIGDLAYALPLPSVAEPRENRLAVSMRPLAPEMEAAVLAALTETVRRLTTDGWTGAFLPMAYGRDTQGEDDATIYDAAFRDELDLVANPLAAPFGEGNRFDVVLDEWMTRLAGHRLVIGARLHAVLLAVTLGVPTVAIAYERKVLDAFTDLGLADFVLLPDADADTLHATALRAAAAPEVFRAAAGRVAAQGAIARDFVASVIKGLP